MKDGVCVKHNYIKQILFENRLVDIEIGWHKVEGLDSVYIRSV